MKARLCVQGCAQIPGIDLDQIICAAMRPTSVRALAAIANSNNMKTRRWDFFAAYLQGSLEQNEVIYCHAPPGYATLGEDNKPRVCRIDKPVYGMAQAGRRHQRGATRLTLGRYVNNLFTQYSHDGPDSLYAQFVDALTTRWNVEDEGPVSDLLNVDIVVDEESVILKQKKYIAHLVKFFLPDGVPLSFHATRAPASEDLPKLVENALRTKPERTVDQKLMVSYLSLVGALLYCSTQTKTDVAYAVGILCRAMSCQTSELIAAAHRVLIMYLSQHRTIGLRFLQSNQPVADFSDSDWATRHSTSGYRFRYNQVAISWASKKQPSVALSSCEAEIIVA
eukprot:6195363-Pleurochrysis_carterae.AAC.2